MKGDLGFLQRSCEQTKAGQTPTFLLELTNGNFDILIDKIIYIVLSTSI